MEIFIWLMFGFVSALVAANKGRSGCAWLVLGVLLGPFGFILSLVVSKNQKELDNVEIESGRMRKCPSCAEIVKAEAVKCRFCGSELPVLAENNSRWPFKWFD